MKNIILILLATVLSLKTFSQSYPPSGLTGIAMHNWLKKNWYDGKFTALGYSDARHAMYDDIDHKNGFLIGVYGGYSRAFTIGGSFTQSFPITTEHTVPQSFFNYLEPMKSDIHHLFPAHNDLNVGRSNYPFMEINDASTEKWWINTTSTTTIPTSNIDNYSEEDWQKFEPRHDHKGNVARAVFYFYTMYKNNVRTINDCSNITDLYNWHLSELVDTDEITRNDKTEIHQGNRNPYIDYPELIGYAWGFTSDSQNPYLNFTTDKVAIHPDLADGKSVTIELEISPKPQFPETITISADANSTLTNYTFSKTSFTVDSASSLQSFTVNLTGNTQGYLQINFNGLSPNTDYGYNDKFFLYVSENLGDGELVNQKSNFEVYPNPFNEVFTISISEDFKTSSSNIRLYDLLGKRVDNIKLSRIDSGFKISTTNLSKGIYFLEIEGAPNGRKSLGRKKIIKY